jgi:hypothetical protein
VSTVDQLAEAVSAEAAAQYGGEGVAASVLSLLATYVVRHGFVYYAMSKWAFDMSNQVFELDT